MDLWALGVMIYQMRVGKTPFHASFDYEVFKKIEERQLVIPNELEPEAVDIINQLLQIDPQERLGTNKTNYRINFDEIKSHPYFKGINFETLPKTSPPIPANKYQSYFDKFKVNTKPEEQKTGATARKENMFSTDFVSNDSDLASVTAVSP